jgi:hypothetical protein
MANNWLAPFGLRDCKVATWNSAGSYGTVYDVPSIQSLATTLQFTQAQLTGDDQITATAARSIGGECKMRFGGLHFDAMGVIMGIVATTISSVYQFGIGGGKRMPYFGIVGKMLLEEPVDHDLWMYIPKAKLMGDFTVVQGEYGAFTIPEVTVQLVTDTSYGIFNLIEHLTDTTISVIPPTNIAVVS